VEHVDDTLPPDLAVARVAAAQYGVVHFAQLRAAGLGTGAINSRVRAGRLHRLYRSVFAVGHTHLSRQAHWLAAVLALGEGALLSHVSAAALWGIRPSSSTKIHVTVPTSAGRPHRAGIVVHRSRTLATADIAEHEGIPATSIARTQLDIASLLKRGPLERAVERSLILGLFDLRATARSSPPTRAIAAPPRSRRSLPRSMTNPRRRALSSRRSCATSATRTASRALP
jgi:hypothetical protein